MRELGANEKSCRARQKAHRRFETRNSGNEDSARVPDPSTAHRLRPLQEVDRIARQGNQHVEREGKEGAERNETDGADAREAAVGVEKKGRGSEGG